MQGTMAENGRIGAFVLMSLVIGIHALPLTNKDYPEKQKPYENPDLFEGDILFPNSSQSTSRGVALRGTTVLWPNGIVPYEISAGHFSSSAVAFIINTMRVMEQVLSINNRVCIQFRPRNVTDPYYITIINGFGCYSYIGQNAGINMIRAVSLQYPGCHLESIVIHEFLHTLGFYHEQSRPDRDNYVRVNYFNIQSGYAHNFDKYNNTVVDTLNTPYDHASVMHYEKDAFSYNRLPTIESLIPGIEIGQRINMSIIDIEEVRLLYNCSANRVTLPPVPTTTTPNMTRMNFTFSSALNTSNSIHTRHGAIGSNYFYEAWEVYALTSGTYTLSTISSIDTFGYFYVGTFYPNAPSFNLLTMDDNSGGSLQFQLSATLQPYIRHILVITTNSPGITGLYNLSISGPGYVSATRRNPGTTTTTTTTSTSTTTTTAPSFNTTYSSSLTVNSDVFYRTGTIDLFYYEAIEIIAPTSGQYRFYSVSNADTFGYLYSNRFNPYNLNGNILTWDDHSGGNFQFSISFTLQANSVYVLVFTTHSPRITTSFSLVGIGPDIIQFVRINNMTAVTPNVITSTSHSSASSMSVKIGAFMTPINYAVVIIAVNYAMLNLIKN